MNEESIFAAALEKKSPQERETFLDEACQGNAELRAQVEDLLSASAAAGSFFEHPPAGIDVTIDAAASDTAKSANWSGSLAFLQPCNKPGRIGQLGVYEIIEVVGSGGMGVVLRAFDTKLSRVVAVKVMAPELAVNPTAVKRFLREAKAAAAVVHDHVVTIHNVEESHQPPFLVMQFVDGQTLQQKIEREGALELKEILRVGCQAAAGLAAAHKHGVIHRDVKPANILLENGIERVKITDFGLARAADDVEITQTGLIAGTPQYMSPEQAKGEALDARSDLFSLGSVLYTMCTGRPAFRAETTMGVLRRVCDDAPRPIHEVNAEIPRWLEGIANKLLAKNPADRFQTASEVAELLGQHLAYEQNPGLAPRPAAINTWASPTPSPLVKEPAQPSWYRLVEPLARRALHVLPIAWLLIVVAQLVIVLKVAFSGGYVGASLLVMMLLPQAALATWLLMRQLRGSSLKKSDVKYAKPVDAGLLIEHPVLGGVAIVMLLLSVCIATYMLTAAWMRSASKRGASPTAAVENRTAPGFLMLDLQSHGTENLSRRYPDLKPGQLVHQQVPFAIGSKLVHLSGRDGEAEYPRSISSIAVDRSVARLHVLHATQAGAARDTPVAIYKIHYDDGTAAEWTVLHGRDVDGYLVTEQTRADNPAARKAAYTGQRYLAGDRVRPVRLYYGVWENPAPEKRVAAIDFQSLETKAAPFCVAMTVELPESDGKWVSLFNGQDLTGWKTHPDQPGNWKVDANGILVGTGPASHLFSERGDYEDFHLRVEAKVSGNGSNAGVWFRTSYGFPRKLDWGMGIPDGYEAEIYSGPATWKTGSLTRIQPFARDLIRPNQWFALEVIAEGNRIRIKVNGVTTVDVVDSSGVRQRGHLALQVLYGNTVLHVRKVEIKELPPSPPAPPADPFVIVTKDGNSDQKFSSLAEAVAAARSGGAIEIRGNGPFESEAIQIRGVALAVRSGEGFRPVIVMNEDDIVQGHALLTTNAPLVLEGLELVRTTSKPTPTLNPLSSVVVSRGAPFFAANCRFENKPRQNCVFASGSPICYLQNCEFVLPSGVWNTAVTWYCPSGGNMTMDNCLQPSGMVGPVVGYTQPALGGATIRLSHNTLLADYSFALSLETIADLSGADSANPAITVDASENIFDSQLAAFLIGNPQTLTHERAQELLPALLRWKDQHNLYPSGVAATKFGAGSGLATESLPGLKTLEQWKQFWNSPPDAFQTGRIRYQGTALVTPADFRLADGSPGKGSGAGGKDLGADVDLVGPGAAYERWKKTAEYQEWLKQIGFIATGVSGDSSASSQAPQDPTPFVWGPVRDGWQVGVGWKNGKLRYAGGELVEFELKVRNATDAEKTIRIVEPSDWDLWYSGGSELSVRIFGRDEHDVKLAPREEKIIDVPKPQIDLAGLAGGIYRVKLTTDVGEKKQQPADASFGFHYDGPAEPPFPANDKPLTHPDAKYADIAWGKPVLGLSVGIRDTNPKRQRGGEGEAPIGDFEFFLWNAGAKPAEVNYIRPHPLDWQPMLRDKDGKEYHIEPILTGPKSDARDRLDPAQVISLGTTTFKGPWLSERRLQGELKPGSYHVWTHFNCRRLDYGHLNLRLTSGEATVDIKP